MRDLYLFMSAAASLMCNGAVAAATIRPVAVIASSSFSGYGAGNVIDLSANTDWASASQGVGSALNLDLGAAYALTGLSLVDRVTSGGSNGLFQGGLFDFTTAFSLTAFADTGFTDALATYSFVKPLPLSASSSADFGYTVSLTGFPTARYLRYTVLASTGANVGLSDISFATSPVPEPASWAMMIAGFGAVAGAMRRRRVTVAFA